MTRAPRYHASGDCIHADPLSLVSPEGRTFSVYSSDSIETHGLIAAGRSGLVFYDNDRELFLNRPLFADLLSVHPTPTQLAIINEFSGITTWKSLRNFFVKLDKILILEQFRQYLADPEADRAHRFFVTKAAHFCKEEGIPLRQSDLAAPDGLYRLTSAIGSVHVLKQGMFRETIPDLLQDSPDSLLVKSATVRRAERWIAVARKAGELPPPVQKLTGGKKSQSAMLREIVAKYLREMEAWENSPLMTLNGSNYSRRDAEEFLFDSQTTYCPSPLGFTPRLRFVFPAPVALADEPLEVKIAVVSALETTIRQKLGFPVKILYLQERHCFLLESIGDSKGSEITLAYADASDFERSILFSSGERLALMTETVSTIAVTTSPESAERVIDHARRTIVSHQEGLLEDQFDSESFEMLTDNHSEALREEM